MTLATLLLLATATTTTVQAAPNLRIAALSGGSTLSGASVKLVIENSGTSASSEFYADLFLDPTTRPKEGQYGDQYVLVDGLAPGKQVALAFEITSFPAQSGPSGSLEVLLDTDGWITESEESDNRLGFGVELEGDAEAWHAWGSFEPDYDCNGKLCTVVEEDCERDDVAIFAVLDITPPESVRGRPIVVESIGAVGDQVVWICPDGETTIVGID